MEWIFKNLNFLIIASTKKGDRVTSRRRMEILGIASREGIISYQKLINKKYCIHNIEIP